MAPKSKLPAGVLEAMRQSESVIPDTTPAPTPQAQAPVVEKKPKRGRLGIYLDEETVEYMRDICYALGRRYTLGQIIEDGLPAQLASLEARFNDGKPFPPRPPEHQALTVGRQPAQRQRT